ncbi:RHS repeat-associated core domain-containing protein [Pleionea sp. CnH1-48]|uniref:RHS repeat-associated core domain-containing protein n=1 Tax=Pleionea sp. CnH1-48 TaxID=2954494 RepID=UPI002097FC74|nr:RHS repeat-associated core domain-containing protein [Pleionea sp. CnH1-48]MCO7224051.1 Ig-like domain-containing protein [Pleionea sp. CnH1-48]
MKNTWKLLSVGALAAAFYIQNVEATDPYVNTTNCSIAQSNNATSCNITVNWYGPSHVIGSGDPLKTLGNPPCLYHNGQVVRCANTGNETVSVEAGNNFFYLKNVVGQTLAGSFVDIKYDAYLPPFSWDDSTHIEVIGDFDGDGDNDLFVQPVHKDGNAGLLPQNTNEQYASGFHGAWVGNNPLLPEISNWSLQSYAAFSGNLSSHPGDELLLLGHRDIVLLHGDIITPISIFPTVHNAIISWDSQGKISLHEFQFDANPEDYKVLLGDMNNDGLSEIVLQSKTKGSSSYILDHQGNLLQELRNGYLNLDWSVESFSLEIFSGGLLLTASDPIYQNNVAFAGGGGTIGSLENTISQPSISGNPTNKAHRGAEYYFAPSISNNGYPTTLSVSGKPSWMSFNPTTGTLSGIPSAQDIGATYFITITASHNRAYSLPSTISFYVTVLENQPPSVSFIKPQPDESIKHGELVYVSVSATDDVRIKHVEFWLNDDISQRKIDATAPYSAYFHALSLGNQKVQVRAVDHLGQTTDISRDVVVVGGGQTFSTKPQVTASWEPVRVRPGESATFSWSGTATAACYDKSGTKIAVSGQHSYVGTGASSLLENQIICSNNKGVVYARAELYELAQEPEQLPAAIENPLADTGGGVTTTAVGSLPGEFKATPSGTANYSIPIMVAPGSGGLIPQLTLDYDSSSSNGIVGVGWNINGLSAISRCPKNKEQEGSAGTLRLDSNDRLCFDGRKLFAKSGSYWSDGSVYELEDKSPIKITAHAGSGIYSSQITHFTVKSTSGVISTYGSQDAPVALDGKVFTWPLTKQQDASGNYIDYQYTQEANNIFFRLDRVLYTGNSAAGVLPYNAIRFEYEERSDDIYKFVTGFPLNTTLRLAKIKSYVNTAEDGSAGDELRTYTLRYDQATVTKRSLLAGVTACRSNHCLPETTFSWQQGNLTMGEQVKFDPGTTAYHNTRYGKPKGYLLLDMDGDGVLDYWKIRNDRNSGHDDIHIIEGGDTVTEVRVKSNYADEAFRYSAEVMDFNHDGRDDVIFKKNNIWHLYMAKIGGNRSTGFYDFDNPVSTGISVDNNNIFVADYNADGYPDFSYVQGSQFLIRYNRGGDVNQSTLFNDPVVLSFPGLSGLESLSTSYFYSNIDTLVKTADFDGDGVVEYLVAEPRGYKKLLAGLYIHYGQWVLYKKDGSSLSKVREFGEWESKRFFQYEDSDEKEHIYLSDSEIWQSVLLTDINSDGLLDIYYTRADTLIEKDNSDDAEFLWWYTTTLDGSVILNKGNLNFVDSTIRDEIYRHCEYSPFHRDTISNARFSLADYNSDGYADLIMRKDGSSATVHYYNGVGFASGVEVDFGWPLDFPVHELTDVNGDGMIDVLYLYGRMYQHLNQSEKRDLITLIDNGAEHHTKVKYSRINKTSSLYQRHIDAPQMNWGNGSMVTDVYGPIYVVNQVTQYGAKYEDAYSQVNYWYSGLKAQVGRGLLGFKEVSAKDVLSGTCSFVTYRQDFPYRGMVSKSVIRQNSPNSNALDLVSGGYCSGLDIEKTEIEYTTTPLGLPYAKTTKVTSYEKDAFSKTILSEKTVEITDIDNFGNVLSMTTEINDHSQSNAIYKTLESNTYGLYDSHFGGRQTRNTTTYTRTGENDISKVTTFGYFSDSGLLKWSQIDPEGDTGSSVNDPDNQSYGLKTELQRDSYGNITWTIISGDGVMRATQQAYDTKGRYPTSKTSYPDYPSMAKSITESIAYDPVFGVKKTITSPNGQKTRYGYSVLGRLNFENAADGSYRTVVKTLCAAGCPDGAYYKEEVNLSRGLDSIAYFDELGREVKVSQQVLADNDSGATIKWSHSTKRYDFLGRVILESIPFFSGELNDAPENIDVNSVPKGYSFYQYDKHSRVTTNVKPDGSVWKSSYDDLSSSITNPLLKTTTKKTNVIGELVLVTDANGHTISYKYDALGSLRLALREHSDISGGTGNIQTIIKSDHLGRKVQLQDPDKGTISYRYNALGELTWQRDNKGQETHIRYDGIGRKVEHKATYADETLDQHNVWTYDSKNNGVGLASLIDDKKNNIKKEFFYNIMSQVYREKMTYSNGLAHYIDNVHDNEFKLLESYDAGSAKSGIRFEYHENVLVSKTDVRSSVKIWELLSTDANQKVTRYRNGNGLVTAQAYDPYDATLTSIYTDSGSGSGSVQMLDYDFDSVGNLEYRHDLLAGMEESFDYDNVNRVTSWKLTVSGNTMDSSVSYDHLGNIRTKTGIGTYAYGEQCGAIVAGPHAVTKAGNDSFCYDANGNMVSGGGRETIHYNTLDKPTYIKTTKNHAIYYHYDSSGKRFKRSDIDKNGKTTDTLYVGNVEFISENGVFIKSLRHLDGMVLETYLAANEERTMEFLHKDHLGSIDAITNLDGEIVQKFSYDPWGQRRDTSGFIVAGFANVDSASQFAREHFRRGYTGHEHIDEAGLIHMNGRVYDPRLGRFLSADPFIQVAENMQNFNRYSYVLNNPLNATDPSGYFWQAVVVAVLKAYRAYQYVQWLFTLYEIYSYVQMAEGIVTAFKYGGARAAISQGAMSLYNPISKFNGVISGSIADGIQSWLSSSSRDLFSRHSRGAVGGHFESDQDIVEHYDASIKKYGVVQGEIKLSSDLSLKYNTSGSKGFSQKVKSYLNSIKTRKYGNKLLTELAKSGTKINIFESSGASAIPQRYWTDFSWEGSTIAFNPNSIKSPVVFENRAGNKVSTSFNPKYVLAHELYHAWQFSSYFNDAPVIGDSVRGENGLEVHATRYTNQIRREHRSKIVRVQYSIGGPRVDSFNDVIERTQ